MLLHCCDSYKKKNKNNKKWVVCGYWEQFLFVFWCHNQWLLHSFGCIATCLIKLCQWQCITNLYFVILYKIGAWCFNYFFCHNYISFVSQVWTKQKITSKCQSDSVRPSFHIFPCTNRFTQMHPFLWKII